MVYTCSMAANGKGKPRIQRWGTCPVCFHERRFTVNGEMVNHRRWVAEPEPYGEMILCSGSGKQFLPALTGVQIRDYATK
jgi:hypothetical protein